MLVLGIDTTAVTASCAVCEIGENPRIIASECVSNKLTHSQTLLPLIQNTLDCAKLTFDDIGLLAVSSGPGSFTGLRIGISAVKGISFAKKIPCVSVSTLLGLAYNLIGRKCIACSVMDARCNQVYNACFRVDGNNVSRLCNDRAITIDDLKIQLSEYDEDIVLVGDGADLVYKTVNDERISVASPLLKNQNGASVCFACDINKVIDAKELMPSYLRLPQAERERLAREKTLTK